MSKTRMELLEDMDILLEKYMQTSDTWRPALVDLVAFNFINGMCQNDYDGTDPDFLWRKSPDEIMQHILDTNHYFNSGIEFGADQLHEEIREYLINNDFIVDPSDVDDEEYQQLTEGAH